MAGGFLWVFNDYFSLWNKDNHMGIVDEYHLPKQAYYYFRKNFTGKADDNAVSGTATKIVLTADVQKLQADGSDFSLITAALRNNSNACIKSTANITFSVTGPVTPLGPLSLAVAGGKIGLIVRSTTNTGTITVNANSNVLPQASVTITSVAPFDGNVGVQKPITMSPHHLIGGLDKMRNKVTVFDINGRVIKTASSTNLNGLPSGVYVVRIERGAVATSIKMVQTDRY